MLIREPLMTFDVRPGREGGRVQSYVAVELC